MKRKSTIVNIGTDRTDLLVPAVARLGCSDDVAGEHLNRQSHENNRRIARERRRPNKQRIELVSQLYRSAATIVAGRYRFWALEMLRKYIQFDAATWVNANPLTGRIHSVAAVAITNDFAYALQNNDGPGLCLNAVFQNPDQVYDPADSWDDEAFYKSSMYLEILCRYGLERMLFYPCIQSGLKQDSLITLSRCDRRSRFSEEDKLCLEEIAPHMLHGFIFCLEWALDREVLPVGACSAICDAKGYVLRMQNNYPPMARHHLKQIHKLPKRFVAEGHHELKGEAELVVKALKDDLFMATLFPANPMHRLSERERDVVNIIAPGGTIKEAAHQLNISPGTVSGYLNRIYKKLGITHRRHLRDLPLITKGSHDHGKEIGSLF